VVVGSRAFIRGRAPSGAWSAAICARAAVIARRASSRFEQMVDRIADDHRVARRSPTVHASARVWSIRRASRTNIVQVDIGWSGRAATEWIAALAQHGVHTARVEQDAAAPGHHRHIGAAEVERALAAFTTLTQKFSDTRPRQSRSSP